MPLRRTDVEEASLQVLSSKTKQLVSLMLDPHKVLLTKDGFHRDWRGVAEKANLPLSGACMNRVSPTEYCLMLWGKNGGLIRQLLTTLESIDRYDVIDDCITSIYEDYDKKSENGMLSLLPYSPPKDDFLDSIDTDILTIDDEKNRSEGRPLEHYDAAVLFADDDLDFVQLMVDKLEKEYHIKLFIRDRDLLAGLQFESESIVRMMAERCDKVIVVLSPAFLSSNVNKFFTLFAHALSIEKRKRILIPVTYKYCEKPSVIRLCHSLDYYRACGYWDYWEKLRNSIKYIPHAIEASNQSPNALPENESSQAVIASSVATAMTKSSAAIPHMLSKLWKTKDGRKINEVTKRDL